MEDTKKLIEMIQGFDSAMLVTQAESGQMHARPMGVAKLEADGTIWFLTGLDTAKVAEVARTNDVCVSFQQKSAHVSITGTARVVKDRARIKALWSKGADLWFPNGPEDPNVAAMEITPREGEYWDERGMNGLKFALKAAKAFVTGTEYKEDRGEHGHAKL